MKNLVSKNPVLRFKLGRKIIKGLYGIPNGVYYETKMGNALIDSGRYYGGKKISMPIALGSYYEKRDSNGNIIERGRYVGGKLQAFQNNLKTQNSREIEATSKLNISTPNSKNKKPLTANRIISKYSGRKSELGGKSVKDWQNILKDYYAPGTYKNDGIWGDNTEAAYKAYLEKQKLEHPTLDNLQLPTSILPPISNNISNMKIEVPQQTYNRSQIREFMRNKGINPYSFNGALRRALRMVLNGTANDDDKLVVKGMGIFKKGGQLPSRNVIKRFKNKF